MYSDDLTLIKKFHMIMGHSKNSIKSYNSAFNLYRKYHNTSLKNLLAEAIRDQENQIPQNRLKLYNRLMSFRQFLIDNYTGNTISSNFSKIKTFYRYNHVTLPFVPPLNNKFLKKNPYISYDDLLTKEEIKNTLKIADDNISMWIYVLLSSGTSKHEAQTITNQIFYEGTYEYHRKNNFKDALTYLSKTNNTICTCKLLRQKTDKPYYTFLNPEAVQFIAKTKLKNKDYNLNSPLLSESLDYVGRKFRFINDYLDLGFAGGYRRFRPHMLRKFHATRLNQGTHKKQHLLDMESIDSLHGRGKNTTRESYFKDNPYFLKLAYIKCMNNVSLYHKYSYKIHNSKVTIYSKKL